MHDERCQFNGSLLVSALPPLLGVEFVLGSLGNGLALWIFFCHLKPWKSSTVLVVNLAAADFLLITVLPLRAVYYASELRWPFGEAACNACLFMLALNRSGSTIFLMVIAGDRYMRVVHPHHPVNSLSIPRASGVAAGLWLLTVAMTAHIFSLDHGNATYCENFMIYKEPQKNLSWHKLGFLLSFVVPLAVILGCTARIVAQLRRRQLGQHAKIKKALWLLVAVVAVFIVCFLPSNVVQVLIWIQTARHAAVEPPEEFCPALEGPTNAFFITICLTYLNSVLDPIIYYFSSPAVQNVFRKALQLPQDDTAESTEKRTRETGSQSLV